MANYDVTTVSGEFKVKNPQEVLAVLLLMGLEESYYNEDNGCVWAGSYENSFDSDATIIRDKETHEVLAVMKGWQEDLADYAEEELMEEDELYDRLHDSDLDDFDTQDVEEYIQEQLLDREHFEVSMTGNEKLRCADGWAVLITKETVDYFNLDSLINDRLKELNLKRY